MFVIITQIQAQKQCTELSELPVGLTRASYEEKQLTTNVSARFHTVCIHSGPGLAALYIGRSYITHRDRDRVAAHFDGLLRASALTDRNAMLFFAQGSAKG